MMNRPFRISEDIVPIEELGSNAARVVHHLKESGRSIVLTEGGRPAAVLIAPGEFDALNERERVQMSIEEGLADVEAGRFVEDDELGEEIDRRYGPPDAR